MFSRRFWDVLIVESDADVLAASRTAVEGIAIYGVPLQVQTCRSKQEAIALFDRHDDLPELAVAIIDISGGAQKAGLELCQYIREELKNDLTQLIVRTGSGGVLPAREVIDRHELSAFITSEGASGGDYATIKSAVRQFFWSRVAMGFFLNTNRLLAAARSRDALLGALRQTVKDAVLDREGQPLPSISAHLCYFLGTESVAWGDHADPAHARATRDRLRRLEPTRVGPAEFRKDGDDVLITLPERVGIHQPERRGIAEVELLTRSNFRPLPDFYVWSWTSWVEAVQHAWALVA